MIASFCHLSLGCHSPAGPVVDTWNGQHTNATAHKLCWLDDREAKDSLASPRNRVCQRHGSHSLLNCTRHALKARNLLDAREVRDRVHAVEVGNALPVEEFDMDDELWKDCVTLVSLRNWEKLVNRYVTEQLDRTRTFRGTLLLRERYN